MLSQAPLVAVAIAVIILYIERRINRLGSEVRDLRDSINSLTGLGEALLSILVNKGHLSRNEALALKASSIIPHTRHYTMEDYKKLMEILDKDLDAIT